LDEERVAGLLSPVSDRETRAWVGRLLGGNPWAKYIYTGFSLYQPEVEIAAKIVIPAPQIERADFWSLSSAQTAVQNGTLPAPVRSLKNTSFVKPDDYNNFRRFLV